MNETKLSFIPSTELTKAKSKDNVLIVRYPGKSKFILNCIDMAEKESGHQEIILFADDLDGLKEDFYSIVKKERAAGGVVFNDEGEILVIYRRAHWDLPKGKIEKGEGKREAAIREVEEETGVRNLVITEKWGKTRHLFRNKSGKRILKLSYWYKMTAPKMDLEPQAEEDIEIAQWVDAPTFFKPNLKVYPSIRELVYEKVLD